jgi:hypothetical protein
MTRDSSRHRHVALLTRLRIHADDVRRLTKGLDESALAMRAMPDKWSLKELVCHVWRIQDLFEERVEAMLSGDNPAIAPYEDPDGDPDFLRRAARPAGESLQAFFDGRQRLCDRLATLSPEAWHRTGRHPQYPHYDVHFQIEYMLHHEAHHLYQMYQRRAPFGRIPH